MLLSFGINDSWKDFLTAEKIAELNDIEQYIGGDYTPSAENVLRFMRLDLNKVRVVILGQDPYKPAGVANGRAFQPSDLLSWGQSFRQVSLKNIVRLIYKSYNNITKYEDIPSYSYIAYEMESGRFNMIAPPEWFDSIEKQGVLLLNTSLTCKIGLSNSHKGIWFEFTHDLIKYIANKRPDLIWFLWGKEAAIYKNYLGQSKTYISKHPMMCSEKYSDDFLLNNCFKDTMNDINWLG